MVEFLLIWNILADVTGSYGLLPFFCWIFKSYSVEITRLFDQIVTFGHNNRITILTFRSNCLPWFCFALVAFLPSVTKLYRAPLRVASHLSYLKIGILFTRHHWYDCRFVPLIVSLLLHLKLGSCEYQLLTSLV